ncbi:MAG: methionine synthase, partial [Chlorobi bacterium]|nr:methionine synthase [Chlorobiota bacterium]
ELKIPLLIGGATTSKIHTAVKIDPEYSGPVIHIKDAAGAVGVMNTVTDPVKKEEFVNKLNEEYVQLRAKHERQTAERNLLSIEKARANRPNLSFTPDSINKPKETGVFELKDFPVKKLEKNIDWSEFLRAWEIKEKYPKVLKSEKHGEQARKLIDDANNIFNEISENNSVRAGAIFGIFEANSSGDDIILNAGECKRSTIHTMRQQIRKKKVGSNNYALSDFIAPKDRGIKDYIGLFAITAGLGSDKLYQKYIDDNDEYSGIILKLLCDRLAEAFSVYLHEYISTEYFNRSSENFGIRPAIGYPILPDHTEKITLFNLLEAEKRIGIRLTESYMMIPTASVSGLYIFNNDAKYFNVGKIGKDQFDDYVARKADMNDKDIKILENTV